MDAPAHRSVLLAEAIASLAIVPDGVYLDATFGRGGHSREILARLGPQGRLLALDRDPEAIAAGHADPLFADARFTLCHSPFSQLAEAAADAGITAFDGILFDLGVSSPQIDTPERGFSFRFDGPLDMRMDPSAGQAAHEWLANVSVSDLAEVLKNYGEERFAFKIAKAIVAARSQGSLATTGQLADLIRQSVPGYEAGQDAATRSFQAIRIFLNAELEELAAALPEAFRLLKKPGGCLAVIAFHSLEDRIVKRFFKRLADPDDLPKNLPVPADQLPRPQLKIAGKAIRPASAETAINPRARSAVLRVARALS
ncbi:MAG: 16S rRNA (cytosine(1402)-N(4))-methyltransferase RsmH [Zoogloeaceae bacterium]|jgi:16S rRNA (cytosine1402-N4)-methyltransferase|nr:16S rRNA (cytosine(1402)-N(4))-methyltransferase RsmH [Zoogloeaceae bacterium]